MTETGDNGGSGGDGRGVRARLAEEAEVRWAPREAVALGALGRLGAVRRAGRRRGGRRGAGRRLVAPRFIALEGVDGSGKTTQAGLLADALEERGLRVTRTREPGGTLLGERVRQIVLSGEPGQLTPRGRGPPLRRRPRRAGGAGRAPVAGRPGAGW